MKKLICTSILSLSLLWLAPVSADEWVNGYTKSNGTYVQGHYRSSRNSSTWDNYSSKGNRNPYTGKKGSKNNDIYGGYIKKRKSYKR